MSALSLCSGGDQSAAASVGGTEERERSLHRAPQSSRHQHSRGSHNPLEGQAALCQGGKSHPHSPAPKGDNRVFQQ